MGCLVGNKYSGASGLRRCSANPLFGAESGYGPLDVVGPASNPFFEFRTISSADVVRVGDRYYMVYEGVRGPSAENPGDHQFGLGLARSVGPEIDGPWEKFPGNPILMDLPGNIGVGHGDLVIVGPATYLYTATPFNTRGRYTLVRK
jgi:beta-xylosidase